jgi:hypothetical protein
MLCFLDEASRAFNEIYHEIQMDGNAFIEIYNHINDIEIQMNGK